MRVQNWVGRITPTRLLTPAIRAISPPGHMCWALGNYSDICPPEYVLRGAPVAVLPDPGERGAAATVAA